MDPVLVPASLVDDEIDIRLLVGAVEVRAENVLIRGRGVDAKDAARDAILKIARA